MSERYIVTLSGRRVSLAAGCPSLADVWTNHCRTPMYAGHTRHVQWVGHHVLGASRISEAALNRVDGKRIATLALLHEGETATFGDVPGPVKIAPQRAAESDLRERLWAEVGIASPTSEEWELVEWADKIEQAAACQILGLPEPVYEWIWRAADARTHVLAKTTVTDTLRAYPAAEQLGQNSPLAAALQARFESLRTP